jgi:hypothetical protein
LVECLDSFFDVIPDYCQWPETDTCMYTHQKFIFSFPTFGFVNLGRAVSIIDQFQREYCRISFPILLDMTRYAWAKGFVVGINCNYAAVIAHMRAL